MALLLPLLLPRIALFVIALVAMAVISSVADCGWCVFCCVTPTQVTVSMARCRIIFDRKAGCARLDHGRHALHFQSNA